MVKQIPGQISFFNIINRITQENEYPDRKENPIPVGSVLMGSSGQRLIITKANYVPEYNDYYIYAKTENKTGYLGSSFYAGKAELFGYMLISKGE